MTVTDIYFATLLALAVVLLVRNYLTHKFQTRRIREIGAYNRACIDARDYKSTIDYDTGSYDRMLFNPFVWTYQQAYPVRLVYVPKPTD